MTAPEPHPAPRLAVACPAGQRVGRVLTVELGLVRVSVGRRTVRATVGAAMLAAMAGDPGAAPRVGDRVCLLAWADGRVTVEEVLVRSWPDPPRTDLTAAS